MRGSFKKFDRDSEILLRSRMIDLGTHLRIIVAPEEDNATDGTLSQVTKSSMSANYNKPVLFVMNGGALTEFWTNGYPHCPWDAAIRIRTKNRDISHYKDNAGVAHRLGGPAGTSYILDTREERYEETWCKHGKPHRIGGPSLTTVLRSIDSPKKWGELSPQFALEQNNIFDDSTQVKYFNTIDHRWYQEGRPHRDNNKPTSVQETGVVEVMQLSTLLDIRNTKLCIRKEYNWLNEDGKLSRTDGPAIIKLFGTVEITQHKKIIKEEYEDISLEWYYNGSILDDKKINEWITENNIGLGKAPYITNPYFADPEDETCFMMDILQD